MNPSVTIIHVSQVTPSNADSSESLMTLPLTFFDLLWFKLHPVERVFFYRLTNATRSFFDSVIVPKLKSSLSSALSHYLPLAGQLVWNSVDHKPSIVCSTNDAVSFTVAESTADFSQLTGNEPFSATQLYQLAPQLRVTEDSAAVVSFQVTLFPNQGFCIGVTANHAVLDGKTTTMFLKSWAHTCKQPNNSLPEDLIPFYDRTVIKGPPEIDTFLLNMWHSAAKMFAGGKEPENPKSLKHLITPEIDPDFFRFTFELSRGNIQKLRERLKRDQPSDSKQLRLSTFVITFSYAFTCLIRSRGGDPNRPVGYGFAADCRSLLVDPPVPSSYFGNCVSSIFSKPLTAATFMAEDGFLAAARFISDSVEELDGNVAWKVMKKYSGAPFGSQVLHVAGSTRFGVYGLDFGWGRPGKVEVVSIDQDTISMAESRDGSGGVEIGFSLKKHEMHVLIDLLTDELKN
ncbi:unnamed protein product [Microthlaspi erraticum]|uniref:Phenolic glucoside malonyltransferase 1-like n=1 Tax=Microthlaspi erraticum TaxID=1685480 RepID=A0A6D2KT22_9BRAS|nr:unnamed protein product [Microthlaspi erraticum]